MIAVRYVGGADRRNLSAKDLDKLGVEHKAISFDRGVTVDVSNQLAELLTTHDVLKMEFRQVGDDEVESEDDSDEDNDLDEDTLVQKPANEENPPDDSHNKLSKGATSKKSKSKAGTSK